MALWMGAGRHSAREGMVSGVCFTVHAARLWHSKGRQETKQGSVRTDANSMTILSCAQESGAHAHAVTGSSR